MNRAVALALILALLPVAVSAQVEEPPEERQRRVDIFQDRRLIFERQGESYLLRQGPETIYDRDFVTLMDDPSLTADWLSQRNRDYAFWLGTGTTFVPFGATLFYQNFRGTGPLAFFSDPTRTERANAGDWRTFGLSVAGATLAAYGVYNLSLWLLEELDQRHPTRLEAVSIEPRVREWNERLAERLNLDLAELPPPPTPRPSPTPTPSALPGLFTPPTPPVGGPGDYPYGEPPDAVPFPLPVVPPGALPEDVPGPRPSGEAPPGFSFPGVSPEPAPAPSPRPVASPRPSPRPSPTS